MGPATDAGRQVFLESMDGDAHLRWVATGRRDEMNEMMQSISFNQMARTTTEGDPQGDAPAQPTRPRRWDVRARIRRIVTRTTLGPSAGDHVLGEGQWRVRAAI
jgi:hypothetical protein